MSNIKAAHLTNLPGGNKLTMLANVGIDAMEASELSNSNIHGMVLLVESGQVGTGSFNFDDIDQQIIFLKICIEGLTVVRRNQS